MGGAEVLEMIAREGVPAAIEAKYRSEVSRKAGKRITLTLTLTLEPQTKEIAGLRISGG